MLNKVEILLHEDCLSSIFIEIIKDEKIKEVFEIELDKEKPLVMID